MLAIRLSLALHVSKIISLEALSIFFSSPSACCLQWLFNNVFFVNLHSYLNRSYCLRIWLLHLLQIRLLIDILSTFANIWAGKSLIEPRSWIWFHAILMFLDKSNLHRSLRAILVSYILPESIQDWSSFLSCNWILIWADALNHIFLGWYSISNFLYIIVLNQFFIWPTLNVICLFISFIYYVLVIL